MADNAKTPRPVYRNIHVTDLVSYRLPPAGIVSILHRISGVVMFVLLPFVIWMFDTSVTSEISYDRFTSLFVAGCGFVPGWFFKLVALGLIWSYLHHFCAGVRHLLMDFNHDAVTKQSGHNTAVAVLAISVLLTLVLGAKLFGLF
ncbi:succinate dehydrogenase, cytochrome b556 subunit [Aquabacterium soli]|jgi:succinate dehydrogenase / fumarate reductase, cytochrome b subunit|uniref:Succinate dehydrogenase cytochrome b556 subunit n=1 Tax=Aquabacterium soli TaxID=2493092 RepID=A0A3R8S683_9BURK|nr:succinate dehydrogenase, cytochrome b556 subunit [Aquabacterium soli]RRS02511.1 succinate dehydrogenase, cytochrome b556 subunit [Aquabacterium soli]